MENEIRKYAHDMKAVIVERIVDGTEFRCESISAAADALDTSAQAVSAAIKRNRKIKKAYRVRFDGIEKLPEKKNKKPGPKKAVHKKADKGCFENFEECHVSEKEIAALSGNKYDPKLGIIQDRKSFFDWKKQKPYEL